MDIKLRARLSAYSKIDSISKEFCVVDTVEKEQIDDLFQTLDEPIAVTKSDIDELFTVVDEPQSVSKTEIDELFAGVDEPETITKTQIDELFESQEPSVKSISYAEIDSLFS